MGSVNTSGLSVHRGGLVRQNHRRRRHNPIAARIIDTHAVIYTDDPRGLCEVDTFERHYLHATKGWKVDRSSRIRTERPILATVKNIKRVTQPAIVGTRYHVILNPKHRKAA